MKKPRIAITIGDFNGIGPEVALKSILSPLVRRLCVPILIGPMEIFKWHAKRLRRKFHFFPVNSLEVDIPLKSTPILDLGIFHARDIKLGTLSPVAGTAAALAIHAGASLCLRKQVVGLVTAPVSKVALNMAGYLYPGQTEMLAEISESDHVTMMLISKHLRVGLASVHIPIREVADSLSIEKVFEAIAVVHGSLQRDFGVRKPRIAVLGLNPHAGEGGLLGTEDENTVKPAIDLAKTQHIHAEGPFSSDGFFGNYHPKRFDAVVAMYHDQGLIPMKMTSFGKAVNYSAGLKIIRTSPDHGTAFEIAGKGVAHPYSMIEAIALAAQIGRRRMQQNKKPKQPN